MSRLTLLWCSFSRITGPYYIFTSTTPLYRPISVFPTSSAPKLSTTESQISTEVSVDVVAADELDNFHSDEIRILLYSVAGGLLVVGLAAAMVCSLSHRSRAMLCFGR